MTTSVKDIVNGADRGPCTVCGAAEGRACSLCFSVWYCGQPHQRADWKRHRPGCAPYELRSDAKLGRYLVATRDIPAGTVIIRERPVVYYPTLSRAEAEQKVVQYWWVCVGCCVGLEGAPDSWLQCRGCGWPLCSRACERAECHRLECAAFKAASFKFKKPVSVSQLRHGWLDALATLRCCLFTPGSPKLQNLQCDSPLAATAAPQPQCSATPRGRQPQPQHRLIRETLSNFHRDVAKHVRLVRDVFGQHQLSREELSAAYQRTLYNCNTLNMRGRTHGVTGLLCGIAMAEHSCVPNCRVVSLEQRTFETVLVTVQGIRSGEHITVGYLHRPFTSTLERRQDLLPGLFLCECRRCADDTELGLYVGAWCCSFCKRAGRMSMVTALQPLKKPTLEWRCETCKKIPTREDLMRELAREREFEHIEKAGATTTKLIKFIEKHLYPQGYVHRTHKLILRAKDVLVGLMDCKNAGMGYALIGMQSKVWRDLKRRMHLCREMLEVLDVLKPGCNSFRARLLICYLEAALARVQIGVAEKKMTMNEGKIMVEDCFKYLKDYESCVVTDDEKEEHKRMLAYLLYGLKNLSNGREFLCHPNCPFQNCCP